MKYKYILCLFLAGFVCQLAGALFKIMHAPHADMILKIATGVMILAVILLIIKLAANKNKESFLNK